MAVAFVTSVESAGWYAEATSLTETGLTLTSETNGCLFCVISFDDGGSSGAVIDSVTYGGQVMTSCGAAAINTSNYVQCQVFYLVNPPTASSSLVITGNASTQEIYANLVYFSGVNQSTPVRSGTYQNVSDNAGATYTMTITSNASDLTLSVCVGNSNFNSPYTNQTLDTSNVSGYANLWSDHATTAGASITDTWDVDTQEIAMVGFSIMAAGSTSIPSEMTLLGI